MSAPRPRVGRRWLVGGLVALAIVLLAAVIIRSVVLRDSARAVPVDDALRDFRSEATSTTTGPTTSVTIVTTAEPAAPTLPPLPEPGIYRYRTTGDEQIDALGGATHQYPAETTITFVAGGCGVHVRWDALRERRDEWALCSTPEGIELQPDAVQYHEFFGQPDDEALSCDRAVLVVPDASAELVQPQSCTLAKDPWLPIWEILERTVLAVAGTDVEVQHVRMTIDDNDQLPEHLVVDWYLADTGLPVQVRSTKESTSPSPIGNVVYREQYSLDLVSTVPLR